MRLPPAALIALLPLLGCPKGPAPSRASGCVLTDLLEQQLGNKRDYATARMFGVSAYEARGCTRAELAAAEIDLAPLGLPAGSARLDFTQYTTPDGSELYVHAVGLEPDFDFERTARTLLDNRPLTATTEGQELRADRYSPPEPWPIRDGSATASQITRPGWWTVAQDTPGTLITSQQPVQFEPCHNPRGQGRMAFRSGSELWIHAWSLQHFFPEGGCGG